MTADTDTPLLSVRNLKISFALDEGLVRLVAVVVVAPVGAPADVQLHGRPPDWSGAVSTLGRRPRCGRRMPTSARGPASEA